MFFSCFPPIFHRIMAQVILDAAWPIDYAHISPLYYTTFKCPWAGSAARSGGYNTKRPQRPFTLNRQNKAGVINRWPRMSSDRQGFCLLGTLLVDRLTSGTVLGKSCWNQQGSLGYLQSRAHGLYLTGCIRHSTIPTSQREARGELACSRSARGS